MSRFKYLVRCLPLSVLVVAGLLIPGCGDDEASLQFQTQASLTDPAALKGLRIEVDGQAFGAKDFSSNHRESLQFATRRFGVPTSGQLLVRAILRQAGSVAAQGELTLALQPRFEWSILVFRQAADPTTTCFGCIGKIAFPVSSSLANSDGEMLWLVWAGRERGADMIL